MVLGVYGSQEKHEMSHLLTHKYNHIKMLMDYYRIEHLIFYISMATVHNTLHELTNVLQSRQSEDNGILTT